MYPLCERTSCQGGQSLNSQENDETEKGETGRTMPADSVRRLGSLTGNWRMSGKELMPTNTDSFAWMKTALEMLVRKRAELASVIQGQNSGPCPGLVEFPILET